MRRHENEDVGGKLPGFYLYPADLDRELSVLPPIAQAIWVRMLLHMHWSPRRGYLVHPTGSGWTNADIAHMMAMSETVVAKMLDLMENVYGTFSRDPNGIIFNRRMARESQLSEVRKAAGKLGGNAHFANGLLGNSDSKIRAKSEQNRPPSSSTSSSISSSTTEQPTATARAASCARHPSPPSTGGTDIPEYSGNQAFDEWPETDACITERFPATDPPTRRQIIDAAVQAHVGAAQNGTVLTDKILARMMVAATRTGQRSAKLYLTTLPVVVANEVRAHERKNHQ